MGYFVTNLDCPSCGRFSVNVELVDDEDGFTTSIFRCGSCDYVWEERG